MPKVPFSGAARWLRGIVTVAAVAVGADAIQAQTPPPTPAGVQPGEEIIHVTARSGQVQLRNLDTRILELGNRIKFVEGFDPEKLGVTALSPFRIRLHAVGPGVTSVKMIDEFDNVYTIETFVEPDTRELQAYLQRLFPACSIEVVGMRDTVVLKGWVTEPNQIPEIMSVAESFYPAVQSHLTVAAPTQVQLHVKVMEIQRTKLRELGFNFLLVGQQYYINNAIGGLAPLQNVTLPFGGPPAATILPSSISNSEMTFAVAGNSDVFQGFIKALQTEALAKVLAQPVLVTTSGRPAMLHSGGEFPVLVPQSFGNLSIEWRQFGVQMEAVPIVLGNGRLRLDVAPEVSERDFSNAVTINGLVVPGITSRSVNTQVEMNFGETLMIGGLISSRRLGTTSKIPFLGELPWIGAAFSRKSYTEGETELVILVTPQMVAPMAPHQVPCGGPGQATDIPTDHELYLDGMIEIPKFGPECPTGCPPLSTQLIAPGGMPAQPSPAVAPQPPAPAGATPTSGETSAIQRTSAEQVATRDTPRTIANPFHKPANSAKGSTASGTSVARGAAGSSSSVNDASRTAPRAASRDAWGLPGMISPRAPDGQQ